MSQIPRLQDLDIWPSGSSFVQNKEEYKTIVIDNGSKTMKAGFGGDVFPCTFPSLVGRPHQHGTSVMVGMWSRDAYVGDEAQAKAGVLRINYPQRDGAVCHWDDMEKIWHHLFYNELRVCPEEHPVLLSEKVGWPSRDREKLVQIMFETFCVPATYLANDAMLSLYSVGKTSGISVEIGEHVCYTTPVYEGYALTPMSRTLHLGSSDITDRLQTLLTRDGYSFTTTAEREIVRDIKEKHAFVSANSTNTSEISSSDSDSKTDTNFTDIQYELPDGQVITIQKQYRSNCCEPLFHPAMQKWSWCKARAVVSSMTNLTNDLFPILKSYCGAGGLDPADGIHEMVFESLSKCDDEATKKELLSSIVLSGETSQLPNLSERLSFELNQLFSKSERLHTNVLKEDPSARSHRVFRGGSMLATSDCINERWISKAQYDEHGPVNALWRCF